MDINPIFQLIFGIATAFIFGILFSKWPKKETHNVKKTFCKLTALSGIVIGFAIFLNALCVMVLSSGIITVDALFNNDNAYPVLLTVASLAIMLCIAYFQYLLQKQESDQRAKDLFAQSMLDISQFECSGELLNYNIENCRSIFFDSFNEQPCPLLLIRFGDTCLKNYIKIFNINANLSSKDNPEDSKSKANISSEISDNCIKLLLREQDDSDIEADLISNMLLAPYSGPYVKRPEFTLTLTFSFIDQRYPDEQKVNHELKLTLIFSFEPYQEYGTSQVEITSKKIKAV